MSVGVVGVAGVNGGHWRVLGMGAEVGNGGSSEDMEVGAALRGV